MSDERKILYIVSVTKQLTIDIINILVEKGIVVTLLTGEIHVNSRNLNESVKIIYFTKHNTQSTFKRMYSWVMFTFRCFFYLLFHSKKQEIVLVSTPPFVYFLGSFFKRFFGMKFHLLVWDLYPDALVNFGVIKKESFIAKWWAKKNKKLWSKAETIITLGKYMYDATKAYNTEIEPYIIYNWADNDYIKPIERSENKFLIQYGLQNKFIIMYSGNFGATHDFDTLLQTAKNMQIHNDIYFILIGDGHKKSEIANFIATNHLKNTMLLPLQDKEMLPFSLCAADIAVITLDAGAAAVSVPSKTYNILAAGNAVMALSPKKSELSLIINTYECGKVVENGQIHEAESFILSLKNNPDLLQKFQQNARLASNNFAPDNAEMYYKIMFDKTKTD